MLILFSESCINESRSAPPLKLILSLKFILPKEGLSKIKLEILEVST